MDESTEKHVKSNKTTEDFLMLDGSVVIYKSLDLISHGQNESLMVARFHRLRIMNILTRQCTVIFQGG